MELGLVESEHLTPKGKRDRKKQTWNVLPTGFGKTDDLIVRKEPGEGGQDKASGSNN